MFPVSGIVSLNIGLYFSSPIFHTFVFFPYFIFLISIMEDFLSFIFQVFYFLWVLFYLSIYLFWPPSQKKKKTTKMWALSSPTRAQTCAPCIGSTESYHWSTRKVPGCSFFYSKQLLFCGFNIFSYLIVSSYQHKILIHQHSSQSDPYKICHIMSFLLKYASD